MTTIPMPKPDEWVSQSQAAKREGISRSWLSQLIREGRVQVNDHRQVRPHELRHVRNHELDLARGRHKPRPDGTTPGDDPMGTGEGDSFNEARRRRENAEAQLAELKVRREVAELVEWDKIQALNASTAVLIRESLLAIPDRLSAVLAAESDESKVRALMDVEIRAALKSLALALRMSGGSPNETARPA
jgi:phage terminase Nu1 subunit (DNA packaging protein)